MRFITDENIPRTVIRMLRDLDHDVKDIVESGLTGMEDDDIIRMGLNEGRIIITHDKDFGDILSYPLKEHSGVILIRLRVPTPNNTRQAISRVLAAVPKERMQGQVVVVEDWRIRISGRPK